MKKTFSLLIFITLAIAGCTGLTGGKPRIITDALNRQVNLEENLSRIVVVGKQSPMLVNFLYLFETAAEKIVALEIRNQSNDEFIKLIDETIDGKYLMEKGAGAEQISPFAPDLVIMKTTMRDSIGKPMEDISIPIAYVEFENIDQIYRDIGIMASALDETDRGEKLVNNYRTLFNQIREKISSKEASRKPSALILQAAAPDQNYEFSVPAANWLQTVMVEEAGGVPVWKDANPAGGWTDINMEQISSWNPDELFIVSYQGKAVEIVDQLKEDPIWQNLNAVKNNHIYAFPYDYQSWDQPDPRWILGYSWLAHKMNPQDISQDEFILIIKTFYKDFYLLSDGMLQEEIMPRLTDYIN